jgi:hypothetical protein
MDARRRAAIENLVFAPLFIDEDSPKPPGTWASSFWNAAIPPPDGYLRLVGVSAPAAPPKAPLLFSEQEGILPGCGKYAVHVPVPVARKALEGLRQRQGFDTRIERGIQEKRKRDSRLRAAYNPVRSRLVVPACLGTPESRRCSLLGRRGPGGRRPRPIRHANFEAAGLILKQQSDPTKIHMRGHAGLGHARRRGDVVDQLQQKIGASVGRQKPSGGTSKLKARAARISTAVLSRSSIRGSIRRRHSASAGQRLGPHNGGRGLGAAGRFLAAEVDLFPPIAAALHHAEAAEMRPAFDCQIAFRLLSKIEELFGVG